MTSGWQLRQGCSGSSAPVATTAVPMQQLSAGQGVQVPAVHASVARQSFATAHAPHAPA